MTTEGHVIENKNFISNNNTIIFELKSIQSIFSTTHSLINWSVGFEHYSLSLIEPVLTISFGPANKSNVYKTETSSLGLNLGVGYIYKLTDRIHFFLSTELHHYLDEIKLTNQSLFTINLGTIFHLC